MQTIAFTVGDWSQDGHNRYDTFQVEVNTNREEIEKAYQKTVDKIGFDLLDYCEDYEDSIIPTEFAKKLIQYGICKNEDFDNDPDDGDPVSLWPDFYLDIYLNMVRFGNPSIVLNKIASKGTIHLGGYGLYAC